MRFHLVSRIRRPSRRPIVLRPIQTTQAQADALAAIYRRAIERTTPGRERILAAYERTLAEMQLDSADDVRAALDDLSEEIRRIVLLLTPDLRDWALKLEKWHRGRWVRNILSAASVDLETILGSDDMQETIDVFLARNVALIRDVSEQARGRIADAVFRGLQQRAPARDVAKEIAEATGMARKRSLRIASHQTVNLGERLNDQRRRQAGIDTWKWIHSGKLHFRPEHKARDGKVYTDKTAPEDLPGRLPNCGCTSQAVVVFDD